MKQTRFGIALAVAAYLLWSFLSLYWKLLSGVNAYDTFSYRILFTLLTMLLYMLVARRQQSYQIELEGLVKFPKMLYRVLAASGMIALNWLIYIYAVSHNHATDASIGYYMTPLMSVVLARLFLKEHLSKLGWLAVAIASGGVLVLVINTGHLPTISLILGLSFGLYGLLKKGVSLSSDTAMLVESGVIAPFVVIYLLFFSSSSFLDYSLMEQGLLAISGIVTAIPLLLFAEALKRAPLSIIGFIQYLNPTLQFLLAITVLGESVTSSQIVGFILIWLAIAVFCLSQFEQFKVAKS